MNHTCEDRRWALLPVELFMCCVLVVEGMMAVTETFPVVDVPLSSPSTKSPADPTMVFYSMDYGKFARLNSIYFFSGYIEPITTEVVDNTSSVNYS